MRGSPLGALFIVAVALQLVPIALLDVVVTVDGALHLAHSTAFWNYVLQRSDLPAQYATLELLPATNLIPELALGLLALMVGPVAAEKIVIGGFVVGFPLSVAWAISGVSRARWWLAFLAIPMAVSFAVAFGFLNYVYGFLGFVLVAGHVARHRGGWGGRALVGLGGLLTATYAAHVLPFALALLLLAVATLTDWYRARGSPPDLLRRSAPLAVAAAPGLLLTTALILGGLEADRSGSPIVRLAAEPRPLPVTVAGLLSLSSGLAVFDLREVAFTALLAALLAVLTLVAVIKRPRPWTLRSADAYLFFGVVVIAAYLGLDDGAGLASGGGFIHPRLAVVPVLALLLWLADRTWDRRVVGGLAVASLVAVVGLAALRWPWQKEMSDRAVAYASLAPCLARQSTILQVNLADFTDSPLGRVTPFHGEAGRLAVPTDGWDIANLGFTIPYFPVRNRPETDPHRHLAQAERRLRAIPPWIDPLGYQERTRGRIDYIVVYGRARAEAATLADPGWTELQEQLAAGYEPVANSPDGLLEVYERTTRAPAGEAQRRANPDVCGVRPTAAAAVSGASMHHWTDPEPPPRRTEP
jgi:hypothetical protein